MSIVAFRWLQKWRYIRPRALIRLHFASCTTEYLLGIQMALQHCMPGMHNPRAGSGPERVISGPRGYLQNTRNFSWMRKILWMNLNFIELLTILQLITIRSKSDGKNIKLQSISRLVKFKKFDFLILDSQNFSSQFCIRPSSALKILHCGPWPKKVVHLCCMQWYKHIQIQAYTSTCI